MHARINAGIARSDSNVLCDTLEGRPGELHPLSFHLGIESIRLLAKLIDCQPSDRTPTNGIADTSGRSLDTTHCNWSRSPEASTDNRSASSTG